MSDTLKKVNVGPALIAPLAMLNRVSSKGNETIEKLNAGEKIKTAKEHPKLELIKEKVEYLWTLLGVVLLFHGAQFLNLFLCTQVITAFCYERVKSSISSVYKDVNVAMEKTEADTDESKADAKAEAKPDNKHAAKRQAQKETGKPSKEQQEEEAAATKKMLKAVDSQKVATALREIVVSLMACHMVMQGGLARAAVVSYTLVNSVKDKVKSLLEFSGCEDLEAWTDAMLCFALYALFGGLSLFTPSLALAMSLGIQSAQLLSQHGLRVAGTMGKIPDGLTAEEFEASAKGFMLLGGIAAFGTLWQFWALVANSGMAWYFKMLYLPAVFAEAIVGLF